MKIRLSARIELLGRNDELLLERWVKEEKEETSKYSISIISNRIKDLIIETYTEIRRLI